MISVRVDEGRGALESLAAEWETLVGDSYSSLFSGPSWYRAWLEAFPVGRIAVVTVREDQRLVGVLPLARIRSDHRGLFFTRVVPFAVADYQPPIIAPDYRAEVLPVLLEMGLRYFGSWGTYWLPSIPSLDSSVELVRSFFRDRGMPFVEEHTIAPRLRIPPGSEFAAVERHWPASHRTDVRRQRKRMARQGPVVLWQPGTLEEAQLTLEEYFRVHDEKWLQQGYPGRFQASDQRVHFRAILSQFWGRGLHFSTVRCGSTDVSYQFGFFAGGWFQSYRPAYRVEFEKLSPGKVHVALLVEEACRLGWQGIDFLQGAEPYKMIWSNETLQVTDFHAGFRRWSPSYFWFSRGKPYLRRRLQRTEMRITARLHRLKQG